MCTVIIPRKFPHSPLAPRLYVTPGIRGTVAISPYSLLKGTCLRENILIIRLLSRSVRPVHHQEFALVFGRRWRRCRANWFACYIAFSYILMNERWRTQPDTIFLVYKHNLIDLVVQVCTNLRTVMSIKKKKTDSDSCQDWTGFKNPNCQTGVAYLCFFWVD